MAVVDANVDRKGTRAVAEKYLKFLYTDDGQETIARHYYRPTRAAVLNRHRKDFLAIELFPITAIAAGWDAAQERFFATGGVFDSIYASAKKSRE